MIKMIKSHPVLWFLGGFLFTYVLFFIFPVFLNPELDMAFPRYVPTVRNIGDDLLLYLEFSQSRLVGNEYIGNYPPLPLIIFFPLIFLKFSQAYKLLTAINIISFTLVTLVLPIALIKIKKIYQ